MRDYEMMLVITPELDEEQVPGAMERVTASIAARGGEVSKVDRWGLRKLAYPIKKRAEGNYVLTQFKLDPSQVAELEATLRLNEDLLRHLVVRLEE